MGTASGNRRNFQRRYYKNKSPRHGQWNSISCKIKKYRISCISYSKPVSSAISRSHTENRTWIIHSEKPFPGYLSERVICNQLSLVTICIPLQKAGLLTQVSAFSFTFPVSQWYLTMYLNHTLSAKENSAFTVAGPYEIHTHFPIILQSCRHLP